MGRVEEIEQNKTELQKLIGKSPEVSIGELKNWSTSRTIKNLLVVKPKSLEEIQNVVKAARSLKLQVRCAGSLHSWAPLFPDEGNVLIYTKDIKRHDGPDIEVLRISDDDIRIHVMTGTTVEQLNEVELKENVNLLANVVLTEPTYGGIVGAGCHGVGWNFQSCSDFCVQMRIVDSDGELRTFTKADDPEMMKAVQCHLGMFGVIYDMQLQVTEEKIAHSHNDFSYTAGDLFYNAKNLKEIVESNESVEIFYWPFSSVGWIDAAEQISRLLGSSQVLDRDEWDPKKDGCWVRKVNLPDPSTVDKGDIKKSIYYNYLDIRTWIESVGSTIADDFVVNLPEVLTPLASKAAFNHCKETNNGDIYQYLNQAIHFRDNIGLLSVADAEWCFDADKNFNNVCKAVQAVISIAQEEAEKGKFPLNIVIEMRWMSYSDSYLCPAIVGNPAIGGSGHTVYIEVLSYTNTPGWQEFSQKVVKAWEKIPGSRPHWAKEWDNIEGITPYIQKVWSKQIKQFTAALEKSKCDPDGLFLNSKLQEIFFPGKKFAISSNAPSQGKTDGQSKNGTKGKSEQNNNQEDKSDEKKSSSCVLL